jgi:2-polyprenyl-3-methyl-5-hydroxy-6-metoxy-1,4-benzoquinol methylase
MMKIDETLTAQIEPFDTFWEAPDDVEAGYKSFMKFYKRNYGRYLPENKDAKILVISCGAGYFVNLLSTAGYSDVLGIDSDDAKIQHALQHGLTCRQENAFAFLKENQARFEMIIAEQEINHLTKDEIIEFLELCKQSLSGSGRLIVHSLNGANPITGAEALAQNFDHYNTFTDYSLTQILAYAGFARVRVFPLKLYIFYENPINYIGLVLDTLLNVFFRLSFIFYGKKNKIFSKKIAAVARVSTD